MTQVVAPLAAARTWRRCLYLLSAVPLAPVWLGLLVAGWLTVGLLSVTPLVVPALLLFRMGCTGAARVEASLARRLLDADVVAAPPASGKGYWTRGARAIRDEGFWREQAFLALRVAVGGTFAVGVPTVLGAAFGLIATPVLYRLNAKIDLYGHFGSAWRGVVFPLAGLIVLFAWPFVVAVLAAPWPFLASGLLGSRRGRTFGLRGLLQVHAGLYAGVNVLLLAIWAGTTRGYFWPEWTLIPPAVPLAIHAWTVLLRARSDLRRRVGGLALGVELGIGVSISLLLVAIWALTTRATFWPVWAMIGLAVPLAGHATVVAATRSGRARIGVLETTRAGAVDVAADELQRIERDLHDGAQARLVALGMSLGLAEQKLADDPEAARALLAEARAGAGEALRELRDLARGIHPPILSDRGLGPALDALASGTPLDVDVEVRLAARPVGAVETAAYFVAAEALANAGKHSDASRIWVSVADGDGRLVVRVLDDGRGGADPAGRGLSGLRQRVEALDGTLAVTSPAGGPTLVEAVIPCAS